MVPPLALRIICGLGPATTSDEALAVVGSTANSAKRDAWPAAITGGVSSTHAAGGLTVVAEDPVAAAVTSLPACTKNDSCPPLRLTLTEQPAAAGAERVHATVPAVMSAVRCRPVPVSTT